jgi:hypothetical protein
MSHVAAIVGALTRAAERIVENAKQLWSDFVSVRDCRLDSGARKCSG